MRSRAKDDGLCRPLVSDVLSSASSGCVGSKFKARGRGLRGLFLAAGVGDCTASEGSSVASFDSESAVGAVAGVAVMASACSRFAIGCGAGGSLVPILLLIGVIGMLLVCFVVPDELKSRFPQPLR